MVAKGHRLGHLQVGESGHDGTRVLRRQCHDTGLQTRQLGTDGIECGAQVQTQVGGDLIVARSARVQLFADVANQFGESRFDVHMHIFTCHRPLKGTLFYLGQDIGKTLLNRGIFIRGEDARGHQHLGMGPGARDVVDSELTVKSFRRGKPLHKGVRGLAETPAP